LAPPEWADLVVLLGDGDCFMSEALRLFARQEVAERAAR